MKKNHLLTTALILFSLSGSAMAQNHYQIEQPVDGEIEELHVGAGWEVHLIQHQGNTPTTVVINTPCGYYFEEGNEPAIANYEKDDKDLEIIPNKIMPKSTVIEVHAGNAIEGIILAEGAHLTIDTMRGSAAQGENRIILAKNAMLELNHYEGNALDINAISENSQVILGSIHANACEIRKHPAAQCTFTSNDTANVSVKETRNDWRAAKLILRGGIMARSSLSALVPDSPYKSNYGLSYKLEWQLSPLYLSSRWSYSPTFSMAYNIDHLNNDVSSADGHLHIDDSYGGTNPLQSIQYSTFAFPMMLEYHLPRGWRPFINTLSFGITPTFHAGQRFITYAIGDDGKLHYAKDQVSALRTFNIRASAGFTDTLFGNAIHFEVFADLLPTYNKGLGLDKFHQFGINISF